MRPPKTWTAYLMINIGALAPPWGMHHLGQLLNSLFFNMLMNLVAKNGYVSHHFGVDTEQSKPKQCENELP